MTDQPITPEESRRRKGEMKKRHAKAMKKLKLMGFSKQGARAYPTLEGAPALGLGLDLDDPDVFNSTPAAIVIRLCMRQYQSGRESVRREIREALGVLR